MTGRGRSYLVPVALALVAAALALAVALAPWSPVGSDAGGGDATSAGAEVPDDDEDGADGAASDPDDGDADADGDDTSSASGATSVEELVDGLGELVDDQTAEVLSAADVSVYQSERSVVEEGTDLLEEYEGRGDCVVAKAGYLDFLGGTWGCVFQGDSWVDICVVSADADGEGCVVRVWHIDAEDAAEAVLQ